MKLSNRSQQGLSLVELMVSLLLGLMITGAIIMVFISNKQSYRYNDNLARLQENARFAFEILGRDLREAAGIPCGSHLSVANALNNPAANWWSDWSEGIEGFAATDTSFPIATGTDVLNRVAGTAALISRTATLSETHRVVAHTASSASIQLGTTAHGVVSGDLLLICDFSQAAIFQVSNASAASATITHNTGAGSPGNCSKGLGYPTDCSSATGNPKSFAANGVIAKLSASAWYVGNNSRGGRSLYRVSVSNNGGTLGTVTEEVVEDVQNLQLEYLIKDPSGNLATDYVTADTVADWSSVIAARMVLTLETPESLGPDQEKLIRDWYSVFAVRNRQS